MIKQQISVAKFNSRSSDKEYSTIEYDDGSYSCNCPSWVFKRGDSRNCKHIDEVKHRKEININISGLNDNNRVVEVETTSQD